MIILVLNCGSSSIKYEVHQMPAHRVLARGLVEKIREEGANLRQTVGDRQLRIREPIPDHHAALQWMLHALVESADAPLQSMQDIQAVGHRVVHGGTDFSDSVIIDPQVLAAIERHSDLAPLHNPPNLTGIRVARQVLPQVPQVACFDTAFHATIPAVASTYALPYELCQQHGIRRYGFHGTSHRWVARRAAALLQLPSHEFNGITCHLGNGCSITAVQGGRSVDTSMGLTPLEGLVMGTRTGDFDPAILFYLADKGHSLSELNTICNKQSGLLGISGLSNDMRSVLEAAERGHQRAALAFDVFCYRLKKYIGSYLAVLGRTDAVVFTGGIGENAPRVRQAVCADLDGLGIAVDASKNLEAHGQETDVSRPDSRVRVLVVPTDEEAAIASDTYGLVSRIS